MSGLGGQNVRDYPSVAATHHRRELADGLREGAEVGTEERLGTVAQGVLRVAVDVDDDAVGADGDRRTREGYDEVASPARVGGVDDDRQVADRLHDGD
ncbi:MAG: hypothetical protein JWP24_692, partial [Marmoricola sp.]|nr:hypothetical protein [Marmoricola sp.]